MRRPSADPELSDVFKREGQALHLLKRARDDLLDLMGQARKGVAWDRLAQLAFWARFDRAPTVEERRREAARLRQLRQRANGRHGKVKAIPLAADVNELRSTAPKELHMPMQPPPSQSTPPNLIKRVTVEETFDTPVDGLDGPDDFDDAGDSGDDADESLGRRSRR
jgi:hypothetical protein